jgi:hypothetical protein
MLETKELILGDKVYILSKFPAMAGREIMTQYPLTAIPKIGEYKSNEELAMKMLCFVSVRLPQNNQLLALSNKDLINNHVANWEDLLKLEYAMVEYNFTFLRDGKISNFLDSIVEKLPAWALKISTLLSPQSSTQEKRPSKNSKKVTP